MKNNLFALSALALLSALSPQPSTLFAQGTAFTYQGRLNDGANPANGNYDLRFALFDALALGNQVGSPLTNAATAVSNGLFTVGLDFGGGVFPGADRWLDISVRTNNAGAFAPLSPRQKLTATPYAITAGNVTAGGGGLTNVNAVTLGGLAASQFWKLSGNSGTTPGVNFLGTSDAQALELKVNGVRALRLEPTLDDGSHSSIVNVVGGSPVNFVGVGVYGATIAGGGAANYFGLATNGVLADFGSIGGGYVNTIQANAIASTIGGGYDNTIATLAYDSTIGGGGQNTLQPDAFDSTIGGGHFNTSFATETTIGGGYFNTIRPSAHYSSISGGAYHTIQDSAQFATIPGGDNDSVAGSYGFAAGRRAQANHQGAFVWGDSTDADIASTGNDQFVVRASGGFYHYGTGGAQLLSVDPAGRLTTLGYIAAASNSNLEFIVNGQRALGLETTVTDTHHSNIVNVIAGSPVNYVAAGVYGATIAGGGALNYLGGADTNSVSADFGTIGGGYGGMIQPGARASNIGGGWGNWIQTNAEGSTIGGGFFNTIQSEAVNSVIGGGQDNTIQPTAVASVIGGGGNNQIFGSASGSTIGGGAFNTIYGSEAVVPGGNQNVASGDHSFAAGHRAHANDIGAFVWGDSTESDITSTGRDQFVIRAQGGARLDGPSKTSLYFGNQVRQMINLWGTNYGIGVQAYTTYFRCDGSAPYQDGFIWYQGGSHSDAQADPGPGGVTMMQLLNGGLSVNGTFVSTSDRNVKSGFEAVDPKTILEKVVALPITRWHYTNDVATPHLGPVAQDFHGSFAVGADDKHIATVDESGVALAAIQGLNQKLNEKDAEIETLKEKAARVDSLEKRLAQLELVVQSLAER
ncbi:MAG TPA: tail fiber domain-containing protein [Candidatus Binatia bacterium]|jgi:hypothetical protein|nr:tail fiber domain-containing protein [Candidatus Binatia bacterium]